MKAYKNTSTGIIKTSDYVRGCMLNSGQWDEIKGLKKLYYIVEGISGCFGCSGHTSRSEYFTSKSSANFAMKKLPSNKGIVRWIDFEWIN